jgi:hypothetical protein
VTWCLAFAVLVPAGSAQNAGPKPAKPTAAIPAILEAFRSHSVVALSDAHGNEQAATFLKALVRDPGFPGFVNDIVWESGNARYQDLVDRFVRGEGVLFEALRPVWQNTTVANEVPVDEEFFNVVRAVNASQPNERQIRVLLGDPPIDWNLVRSRADHFEWLAQRDSYPAALVQVEVLAKKRRALLVYGHLHFQRKNIHSNLDMQNWPSQTIVSLLESAGPTRVFSIWRVGDSAVRIQPEVASWTVPSVAVIRGTALGAADITAFSPTPARFAFRGSTREAVPRDRWATLPAEEQFDAVLYLGADATMTEIPLSPRICSDARYIEERLRRIALTGIPQAEAERVRKLCGE